MLKIQTAAIAFAAFSLATLNSCSKKDGGEPEQEDIEIVDEQSLADNLEIKGAVKKPGDIPAPESSSYPLDFTLNTPTVVITPGNTFDFELETEGQHPMIVFLQIDGTDGYFELQVDKNGNLLNKTTLATRLKSEIRLKAQPMVMNNMEIDATVQVFQDKQSSLVPNLSNLHNFQNWSPKKRVRIKTYSTGTGDIFATLTWNKEGDIDLWMREPSGNKIYYANSTSSSGGELDYDNTQGYGPENIFYESTPPSGKYEVWVHYYSGSGDPVDWVVSLKNGGSSNNFRGTLEQEDDSVLVTTFTR